MANKVFKSLGIDEEDTKQIQALISWKKELKKHLTNK